MLEQKMQRREFLRKSAGAGLVAATAALAATRLTHAQDENPESPYRLFLPYIADASNRAPLINIGLLQDPVFLQLVEGLTYPIQSFEELAQLLGGREAVLRHQNGEIQVQDLEPLIPAEQFPLTSVADLLAKFETSVKNLNAAEDPSTTWGSYVTVYFYVYQAGSYYTPIRNASFNWISGYVTNLGNGWYRVDNMWSYESQFSVSASGYNSYEHNSHCYYSPCYYHGGQYQISLPKKRSGGGGGGGW